jgi:hypothetical protein
VGVVLRRRQWQLVALVAGAAGCLAPTLPVTPPAQPDVTGPDASGNVTLKGRPGSARANAEVTVWNPNLNAGKGAGVVTIAAGDGSWSNTIPAKTKETLWVWQTIGFERSEHIEVRIP